MRKFDHVDLTTSGDIVYNFKTGDPIQVDKQVLLDFIRNEEENTQTVGPGLTSDPYEREETVYTDPEDFLQDNWEYITNLYYKKELCKATTSITELAY